MIQENNKSFGIVFFIFFLLISFFFEGKVKIFFLFISFLFLFLGLLNSKYLTIPKKLWLKLGELMHIVISPVLLGIIYFSIIYPTKIILTILGKDIFSLKIKKNDKSYWKIKEKINSNMNNQF